MKIEARQKVARKIGSFLKTAQKDEDVIVPEISDEGAPDLPDPDELEDLDDLEDLEEEVEDLEEEEEGEEPEAIEELQESVEEIGETLETVVDALEDQKETIEIALGEKTDTEEEFEDFKEEEDEDLDEEDAFTPEEFGIETEGTDEKEEGMNTASLRAKRNARLKKLSRKAAGDKPSETIGEEFGEDATKKKKLSPQNPAPTITKIKKTEVPEMLKLADLSLEHDESKSKWIVLNADEAPLFEIPLGENDKEEFATEEFAEKVIQEMSKAGIAKTLKKYKATVIKKKKAKEQSKADPAKDEDLYRRAVADVRRRFLRAFKLAATALNKNLIKPVPLKKELFAIMSKLDIDEPQKIIDYAFDRGHVAHIEKLIAQAEKFMDMKDDSLVEAEGMIMDVETVTSESVPEEEVPEKTASRSEQLKRRASRGSLVLSTSTDHDPSDRMSALQSVLPKPANWRVKYGSA